MTDIEISEMAESRTIESVDSSLVEEQNQVHYKLMNEKILSPRQKIYAFLDDPDSSQLAFYWSSFMLSVIVFSITTFCVSTLPSFYEEELASPWFDLEIVVLFIFGIDYFGRFFTCPEKWSFLKEILNIIDLFSIVAILIELSSPSVGSGLSLIRILRLARLFRVLRLGKYAKSFQIVVRTLILSRHIVAVLVVLLLVLMTLASSIMFYLERGTFDEATNTWIRDGEDSPFQSIPSTYYWCIVTMTTVGYGDAYPTTLAGKIVGAITIVLGSFTIAFLISAVGSNFTSQYSEYMAAVKAEKNKIVSPAVGNSILSSDQSHPESSQHADIENHAETSLREKIFFTLDDPSYSDLARYINMGILVCILFSVVVFVVESLPQYYSEDNTMPWYGFECFVIVVFTIDYTLRVMTAPNKLSYMLNPMNIIDLAAIIPFYLDLILSAGVAGLSVLRTVRLIRVFRVLRLGKYSMGFQIVVRTLVNSRQALSLLVFILSFMVVIFSSLMYYAERGDYEDGNFCRTLEDGVCDVSPYNSIIASFWWSIVTLTTVGYGEIVPVTNVGKFIAGMASICGILALAFPITILGNNFAEEWNEVYGKQETDEDKNDESQGEDEEDEPELTTLRERIFALFENPQSSRWAYWLSTFYFGIIIISIVIFCYDSTLDDDYESDGLYAIEIVLAVLFTVDVLSRIVCAPNRLEYTLTFLVLVDLISVIPFYLELIFSNDIKALSLLRVVRLVRIVRLIRLSKIYSSFMAVIKTVKRCVDSLSLLLFLIFLEVVMFSSIMYYAERGDFKDGDWILNGERSFFQSIPDTAWWAIVTLTTVGYGDKYPVTEVGKIVAGVTALCGVLSIAFPITIISNTFAEEWNKTREPKENLKDLLTSMNMKVNMAPPSASVPKTLSRKQRVAQILDQPDSIEEIGLCCLLAMLAVCSIVVSIVSTLDQYQDESNVDALLIAQGLLLIPALVELVARLYAAEQKKEFFISPINLIEICCCILYIIDLNSSQNYHGLLVLRAARLVRIFEVFSDSVYTEDFNCIVQALRESMEAIVLYCILLSINVVFFSSIIWYFERGNWEDDAWRRDDGTLSPFSSIPETFWWAIVTMGTVGYGEVVPITIAGKLVASLTMLSGILTLAFPIAIISSALGSIYQPHP